MILGTPVPLYGFLCHGWKDMDIRVTEELGAIAWGVRNH